MIPLSSTTKNWLTFSTLIKLVLLGIVFVVSDGQYNVNSTEIPSTNSTLLEFVNNSTTIVREKVKVKNEQHPVINQHLNVESTTNLTSSSTTVATTTITTTTTSTTPGSTISNNSVSSTTKATQSPSTSSATTFTTVNNIHEKNNLSDSSTFTQSISNDAANNTTITCTTMVIPAEPVLPDKGSAEDEHNSSMSIFFVLCVLALGILLIHLMLLTNFQYLPESVVIVFLGAAIGMFINFVAHKNIANWKKEEAFSPTAFFLVLLPPIIFESGYNLHKGNFFQNIGSIMVFAIFGTAISAFVIGAGIYFLGLAQVVYRLSFVESFAFGSLISAVDPVATVAIFHALDVDPVLNMLVFGESILNDAISIVLTTSILESNSATTVGEAIILSLQKFCLMFFASAGIGVVFALMSALLLKHIDLRKNPSLEFGLMLVFTYAPYVLAEGIQLSGKIKIIIICLKIFFFF